MQLFQTFNINIFKRKKEKALFSTKGIALIILEQNHVI